MNPSNLPELINGDIWVEGLRKLRRYGNLGYG